MRADGGCMWIIVTVFFFLEKRSSAATKSDESLVSFPNHPQLEHFTEEIIRCSRSVDYCNLMTRNVSLIAAKMAYELASIHLDASAIIVFEKALLALSPACGLRSKLTHYLSTMYFSIGNTNRAQSLWLTFSMSLADSIDILQMRSQAIQSLLLGHESAGLSLMSNYSSTLKTRLDTFLLSNSIPIFSIKKTSSPAEYDNNLLSLLLYEAQGSIKLRVPITDLQLLGQDIKSLDVHQRFYLAVGLAKLGLYDLSLRHVSLIATPWEAPLYNLRAKLIFSPIHSSMRSLALSVDSFFQSGEDILMRKPSSSSPLMADLCNSFNDASLALQALPLLHLAGYSSPREKLILGQSPIALPMLLSEVFTSMCPLSPIDQTLQGVNTDINQGAYSNKRKNKRIVTVGVVSGSFDAFAGRLVIGMLQSMSKSDREGVKFIAICFPTPRDALTDIANSTFDGHLNLPSNNKTEAVNRILELAPSILIFTDAGLDSRVFALAHERISLYQCALWGWGGTIGIPSIDFYIIPEVLWQASRCPQLDGSFLRPQQLFAEQVVLLEGLPTLWTVPHSSSRSIDLRSLLMSSFLVPDITSCHIYLFPGTVTQLHPEFDVVISLLLNTDPLAVILLAIRRTGRDTLPTNHAAVRHDLMHPANAAAAIHKLFDRLRRDLGNHIHRLRVLPPLDGAVYDKLLLSIVAVLDPFPVGVHEPIIDALSKGVPIVSSPFLQECTNSHSLSIATHMLPLSSLGRIHWPMTPDEYVYQCLQLQTREDIRKLFQVSIHHKQNHGFQISKFVKTLLQIEL